MATVWARSVKGAMDTFLRKHKPRKGGTVSIKLRGQGDWTDYEVY
jgi:hypothetical protein